MKINLNKSLNVISFFIFTNIELFGKYLINYFNKSIKDIKIIFLFTLFIVLNVNIFAFSEPKLSLNYKIDTNYLELNLKIQNQTEYDIYIPNLHYLIDTPDNFLFYQPTSYYRPTFFNKIFLFPIQHKYSWFDFQNDTGIFKKETYSFPNFFKISKKDSLDLSIKKYFKNKELKLNIFQYFLGVQLSYIFDYELKDILNLTKFKENDLIDTNKVLVFDNLHNNNKFEYIGMGIYKLINDKNEFIDAETYKKIYKYFLKKLNNLNLINDKSTTNKEKFKKRKKEFYVTNKGKKFKVQYINKEDLPDKDKNYLVSKEELCKGFWQKNDSICPYEWTKYLYYFYPNNSFKYIPARSELLTIDTVFGYYSLDGLILKMRIDSIQVFKDLKLRRNMLFLTEDWEFENPIKEKIYFKDSKFEDSYILKIGNNAILIDWNSFYHFDFMDFD